MLLLAHQLFILWLDLAPASAEVSIITAVCLQGQECILHQLFRQLDGLVLLELQSFDQCWRKHQVLFGEERVSCAFGASASRASNSMHVVFQLLRHVVVDDELNVIDVEATARHISSNKHCACPALLELFQQLLTHLLILVAMDALDSLEALLVELAHKIVNAFLCLAENYGARLNAFNL